MQVLMRDKSEIEENLRQYMKIPAKKKLEILEELHRMAVETSSPKIMKMRWKLREELSSR